MVQQEITPQSFWSSPETADWWIRQDGKYKRYGHNNLSEEYLYKNIPQDVKRVLEAGAGTGRLIGMFKELEAHSLDINSGLCRLVKQNYPWVITHNCPITAIDMGDNSVDMVYTYQVLQHVPNDQIRQALRELLRVTKDYLWLMEGCLPGVDQGQKTQPDNGGSFTYYFDQILKCESVGWLEANKIRIYKIRKLDNLGVSI